jgi:Flp pilus assembly protein TadB
MEVASVLILPATPILRQTLVYFYEPQPISISLTPVWQPPKV